MLETIVKIKFGSHLYGTSTPESGLDIKAVYIPSASDILLQRINPVAAQHRLKQHGEKNTSSDTDFEAYSLQRYLELLAEGQTVALDMLFAPDSAMLEEPHGLWREIQSLSPQLLTRGATAFVRYCRQQANKYGIKGSRVAAVLDDIHTPQEELQKFHWLHEAGALTDLEYAAFKERIVNTTLNKTNPPESQKIVLN